MSKISISRAVDLIRSGEVVAFPTETVYGLGADAWNPTAVQKVFSLKERPPDNPLIVHIASREMVEEFAAEIPEPASKLADRFWPGPLTMIFKKKPDVLDIISGGLDTIALRWPSHPISQELIYRSSALVAPSANKSGRPSPTRPEHVEEDFGEKFPVIDGGSTQIGLESTVLDVTGARLAVYRPGYVSDKEIENTAGLKVETAGPEHPGKTKSPGTRYTHYAPRATVRWLEPDSGNMRRNDTLYILHRKNGNDTKENVVSYDGDYRKMARELFDRFRQADHLGYKAIAIEPLPKEHGEQGLVSALQNRISKAAGESQ